MTIPIKVIRHFAQTGGTIDTVGRLAWNHIYADGSEKERIGDIWCDAPPCGGRAWWVVPHDPEDDEPMFILVVRSSMRRRVGLERKSTNPPYRMTWRPLGGRYVDKGEFYSEADPRSRTGSVTHRKPGLPRRPKTPAGLIPATLTLFQE